MSEKVVLRSGKDRLRYTVIFELLLLTMLVPLGAAFFDKPLADIGVLGLILASKAMLINLVYNWIFDKIDAHAGRLATERSHIGRIFHAIGFETSLVVTSLPIYSWWLDIGLLEALMTDIVVTSFVVAYTYFFTLAYDRLFPLKPRNCSISM